MTYLAATDDPLFKAQMQGLKEVTASINLSFEAEEIYLKLQAEGKYRMAGWFIGVDQDQDNLIWIVNPYGIDVGVYEFSIASCVAILNRIRTYDEDLDCYAP